MPGWGPRGFRERVEGPVNLSDVPLLLERELPSLRREGDDEEVRT
ncbi:MAG: hypothetical protein QXP81_08655 [Nitrososphaerota archaeon]